MNRTCENCRRLYVTTHPDSVYCSRQCAKDAQALAETERVNRVIDGQLPGTAPVRRDHYDAVCGMCVRQQGEYMLSVDELKAMRPLPRCTECAGFVNLSPTFSCGLSSPTYVKPIHNKTMPVRPVRRVRTGSLP